VLDFDVDLTQPKSRIQPVLTEEVTVRPVQGQTATVRVALDPSAWNWSDLRDYIMSEVERRHGPQVRDAKKEAGIIKAFIGRWGIEQAVAIAKVAFTVHDGMWRNAPISINRFCRASDPYFAGVIAKNL